MRAKPALNENLAAKLPFGTVQVALWKNGGSGGKSLLLGNADPLVQGQRGELERLDELLRLRRARPSASPGTCIEKAQELRAPQEPR